MCRRAWWCKAEVVSLRCLIVDDDVRFGSVLQGVLERQGISVVATATSTQEAIRLAEELAPDFALVDIGLGEESGFELTEHLYADPGPTLNVILISTRSHDDFADLIEASPAVGFLPKSELSAHAIYDLLAGRNGSSRAS